MTHYDVKGCKMRLQFTIDENLGSKLQAQAHELGFSVSSYVRHLVKQSLSNKKISLLNTALQEPSELISFKDFRKQLNVE